MLEGLTNILKFEIDKKLLNNKYVFLELCDEDKFKVNRRILDKPDNAFRSVHWSNGKYLYIMMGSDDYLDFDPNELGESVTQKRVTPYDMDADIILNLLLKSLPNCNDDYGYNNITGSLIEVVKKGKNNFTAIEFNVRKDKYTEYHYLKNSVARYTSLIPKNCKKPQYVLYEDGRTVRSADSTTNGLTRYIKKGTKNKATYPFMELKKVGRAKEMWLVLNRLNAYYKGILSIEFLPVELEKSERKPGNKVDELLEEKIKNYKLEIVNYVKNSLVIDDVEMLKEAMKAILGVKVSTSTKPRKGYLTIGIAREKDYYDENNIIDPYKEIHKYGAGQCINSENVKEMLTKKDHGYILSSAMKTVLKELIIKDDVLNGRITIDDWSSYGFSNDWEFSKVSNNKNVYTMKIKPSGRFEISNERIDLFSNANLDLIDKFGNSNYKVRIIDDKGNVNYIMYTEFYGMPDEVILEPKNLSKGKDYRNKHYPLLVDINRFKIGNNEFYTVGSIPEMQGITVNNAIHLYKVEREDTSKNLVDELWMLMNVQFVKLNNITVKPYPVKYLDEYINMQENN